MGQTCKLSNTEIKKMAKWMLKKNATLRATATQFHVSKSTVHRYCRVVLPKIDKSLAVKIGNLLDNNWQEAHVRGGNATKMKYLNRRKKRLN